jgi:hypothetical protein
MTCFNPWPRGESFYKRDAITPKAIEKADRVKALKQSDAEHNAEVRERSKGQCEVVWFGKVAKKVQRCAKVATEIHHLYGGSGVRARGKSCLAKHKLHCCNSCHSLITSKILRRVGGEERLWTDEYERLDK